MNTIKKTICQSLTTTVIITAVLLAALYCAASADPSSPALRAYGGVGLDAAVVAKLGVERQIAAPTASLTLHASALVTLPILRPGGGDADVRAGLRAELRRGRRFVLGATLSPFARTTSNVNYAAVGLGVDVELTPTVTFSRAAAGLELGYDRSLADNFQHTDAYRTRFYADVHDGWYQGSAAQVRAGLRGEVRITGSSTVRARAGMSATTTGHVGMVPYFAELGTSITF